LVNESPLKQIRDNRRAQCQGILTSLRPPTGTAVPGLIPPPLISDQVARHRRPASAWAKSLGLHPRLNYTSNRNFTNNGFDFTKEYAALQFGSNYKAINS